MSQEVTNEELARMIAKGFAGVDKRFEQVAAKTDVEDISRRLGIVDRKLDNVLYKELDVHERWIQQLAEKVGVVLVR